MLETKEWKDGVRGAIAEWTRSAPPTIVLIAVNRSECGHCTAALVEELQELYRQIPATVQLAPNAPRFVFAALGLYVGSEYEPSTGAWTDNGRALRDEHKRHITTDQDLRRMVEAKWTLAVLQFGNKLTQRGHWLHQGLTRVYRSVPEAAVR